MRKILLLAIIFFPGFIHSTCAVNYDTLVKENNQFKNTQNRFVTIDANISLKQASNLKDKFKSYKSLLTQLYKPIPKSLQ